MFNLTHQNFSLTQNFGESVGGIAEKILKKNTEYDVNNVAEFKQPTEKVFPVWSSRNSETLPHKRPEISTSSTTNNTEYQCWASFFRIILIQALEKCWQV